MDRHPSKFEIAKWWCSEAARADAEGWWPVIDLGEPSCMACRYYAQDWDKPKTASGRWSHANLDRAHIIAQSIDGPSEPGNFLLLCRKCHVEAPMTNDRNAMLAWAKRRPNFEVVRQRRVVEELRALGVSFADCDDMLDTVGRDRLEELMGAAYDEVQAGSHFGEGGSSAATAALVIARVMTQLRDEYVVLTRDGIPERVS